VRNKKIDQGRKMIKKRKNIKKKDLLLILLEFIKWLFGILKSVESLWFLINFVLVILFIKNICFYSDRKYNYQNNQMGVVME
jgi:hypothetical protein